MEQQVLLGGYTLSKTAVEMNLYDILKVLEGELSMTGSEEPENETDLRSFLREEVWDVIDKNIEESLKKTTIKHMKEEFNKQDDSNFCGRSIVKGACDLQAPFTNFQLQC